MQLRTHRKTRGFTLAEVLVSLALMAVIMVAAAMAIYAAENSHAYNAEKNDLLVRARGTLDRISQDVRRCSSFAVTDTTRLDVTMPNGDIHTYQYSAASNGSVLYCQTVGLTTTTPTVLTNSVHAFIVIDAGISCRTQIVLQGTLSQCTVTATATPGKSLF
jgi:prepilin-type N-terminal cleavage/methylation domain-containing protein